MFIRLCNFFVLKNFTHNLTNCTLNRSNSTSATRISAMIGSSKKNMTQQLTGVNIMLSVGSCICLCVFLLLLLLTFSTVLLIDIPLELFLKFNKVKELGVTTEDMGKAISAFSTQLSLSDDKLKVKRKSLYKPPENVDERTVYVVMV